MESDGEGPAESDRRYPSVPWDEIAVIEVKQQINVLRDCALADQKSASAPPTVKNRSHFWRTWLFHSIHSSNDRKKPCHESNLWQAHFNGFTYTNSAAPNIQLPKCAAHRHKSNDDHWYSGG
jgi:hypothetical protein